MCGHCAITVRDTTVPIRPDQPPCIRKIFKVAAILRHAGNAIHASKVLDRLRLKSYQFVGATHCYSRDVALHKLFRLKAGSNHLQRKSNLPAT